MRPMISVVTPSLNQGEYIEDAILSVLEQKHPAFEHVVIDGGSNDQTLSILGRYPHIRWVSEPDDGQADALSKGFLMARGDWIGWLNADEYYFPGALESVSRVVTQQPDAQVVYACCAFVDRNGHLLRTKWEHGFDMGVLLHYGCYIPSATLFVRREIAQVHLLNPAFRCCMDFEYLLRLASARHLFVYLERILAAFRWHDRNISRSPLLVDRRRAESLLAREMHDPQRLALWRRHLLRGIYRAKRVLMKVSNGGLLRELSDRKLAGRSTRWFSSPEGAETCQLLLGQHPGSSARTCLP